ncbi:hypothetical protein [Streptomyces sp. NPDC058272]|uniref:hypothetical protein n=1 Tax=Streptomyces sp. NPDC058272 TaxID=3346415 RepID=UPI0036E2F816
MRTAECRGLLEILLNEASRQKAVASEIARLRADVEAYAAFLQVSPERFLDAGYISYLTGISAADRVQELLDGTGAPPEVEPTGKKELEAFQKKLFRQRLNFLWETRTKTTANGEQKYPVRDIDAETGISYQQVSNLLKGDRGPNALHADRLEDFFDRVSQNRLPKSRVPKGFCLRTEGAALTAHLTQMVKVDLPKLALAVLAKELDTTSVALRSAGDDSDIDMLALLPVLTQLAAEVRSQRSAQQD